MESTLAWVLVVVLASLLFTVPIFLTRRSEERIRVLLEDRSRVLERERVLASRFLTIERAHEVAVAERVAIEIDRERLFAELEHRHRRIADALTRIALSVEQRESEIDRVAEAGAERIFARFPDVIDQRERMLAVSLGALLSVRSYVDLAVKKKARIVDEALGANDEAEIELNMIQPAPGSGDRYGTWLDGEEDGEETPTSGRTSSASLIPSGPTTQPTPTPCSA